MRVCPQCGVEHNRTAPLCQPCYMYLRRHPEGVYPLPPKGVVELAINGDVICHECGMAYPKLGNHIRFKHNMTQREYKDKHGLLYSTQLTNAKYKKKMRKYVKKHYAKVVSSNLIKKGESTRFQKGQIVPGRGRHL